MRTKRSFHHAPLKRLCAAIGIASVALLTAGTPTPAYACSCYYAAYMTGYNAADSCCNSAITTAFQSVNAALVASEQTLLEAMGMGTTMAAGTNGFPALQNIVEGAEGAAAKQITDSIALVTKRLALEFRLLPSLQQSTKGELEQGDNSVQFPERVSTDIRLGKAIGTGGRSSRGNTLKFLTSPSGQLSVGEPGSQSHQAPAAIPTRAAAIASSPTELKNRARAHQSQKFQELALWAEGENLNLHNVINADVFVSDEYQTVPDPALEELRQGEMPTSERMDLVMQLLVDDQPFAHEMMERSTTSIAGVGRATDERVGLMRQTMVATILDRYARMRRAHPGSLGAEDDIRESLGLSGEGPVSDEQFLNFLATRRVKDQMSVAISAVSTRHAAQQLAQMEAEHNYLKYQRYLTKRDTALALAQILAGQNRMEQN